MKGLLCLAVLCFFQLTSSQNCDSAKGWSELDGACFRICRIAAETQFTWQEARERCMSEGGDIATVRSQADQDLLISLSDAIGFTGGTLWIGMNQLSNKTGPFTWADGAEITYEDWANNEPRDGGVTNCAFTLTSQVPGDFQRYDYSSATYTLLDPGTDSPTDADGIDTFYFGGGYDKNWDWCEQQCGNNPNCYGYTWYNYHYYYEWDSVCVGRSDRYDILAYDSYGDAGVRQKVGGETNQRWYAGNCGMNKGFACKKYIGSDTPVTVPPTSIVDGFCPEGYFGVGNKCIKVVLVEDELNGLRWQDAVAECRNGPGISPDIVSIHSSEENALITQHLQKNTYGLWIGYHYASLHDQWVWADNTEPRYENWAENEPGDTTNLCVEMWATTFTAGEWHNTRCDGRRGYACQTYKDPSNIIGTPQATTPHECAAGWTPYWYGCYRLDTVARTWASARDNCVSLGGNLVSIHHEAENAAISLFANGEFPVWIGLRTNADGIYEWTDGWPYGYYINFDDNGMGGGEGCVGMKSNGKWNDTVCGNMYASVCKQTDQQPPSTVGGGGYCPIGNWKEFGPYCYYFSTSTYMYQNAVNDCALQGGSTHNTQLASIENVYENEFILNELSGDPYYTAAWIGLIRSQLGMDGWMWRDGSDSNYRNWAPGEPNNPYTENCGEILTTNYPGQWNDQMCEYTDYTYRKYVCKASKGDMPSTPQMPTPGDQECPAPSWDKLGDTCLLIRPNDYQTWNEAISLCKTLAGETASLASIHSEEENWYISAKVREYNLDDYYNPDVWIGMYKLAYGNPYVWEDESEVVYTNWAPGEPNDSTGASNCVRMYHGNGEWDDYFCYEDYYHGYVCQVRSADYQKELAEKGPDHFRSLEDIPPHVEVKRDPSKYRKPQKHELEQGGHRSKEELNDRIPPHDYIYDPQPNIKAEHGDVPEQPQKSKVGEQIGIILGCLVGVALVATLLSLALKTRVDRLAARKEEVAMENVLTTELADSSTTTSYNQVNNLLSGERIDFVPKDNHY